MRVPPAPSSRISGQRVGRIPRRKLPRCGREISHHRRRRHLERRRHRSRYPLRRQLLAQGRRLVVAHHAHSHPEEPRRALLHQVAVDRVRGNHETGQHRRGAHYRFVKEAAKRSGLGYFDDMQFHFGYHNVAEVKQNRAMIRAFERLKKEGLVEAPVPVAAQLQRQRAGEERPERRRDPRRRHGGRPLRARAVHLFLRRRADIRPRGMARQNPRASAPSP